MSQPFDLTARAYDDGDVLDLRAPSLRSDSVESSVSGSRESSSGTWRHHHVSHNHGLSGTSSKSRAESPAGLETILKPKTEEAYSESEEAYIESEDVYSESKEEYSESKEEYSESEEAYTKSEEAYNKSDEAYVESEEAYIEKSLARGESRSPVKRISFPDFTDISSEVFDNSDLERYLASSAGFPDFHSHIGKQFHNRITISDDRSVGSKSEERNLLALLGRKTGPRTVQPYYSSSIPIPQHLQHPQPDSNSSNSSIAAGLDAWAPAAAGVLLSTRMSKEVDEIMISRDIEQVLGVANPSKEDLQKLQRYIELLQAQAREFESVRSTPAPSRYQIIYQILDVVQGRNAKQKGEEYYKQFFDHPEWVRGQGSASQMKSNLPLTNFELYLEKNKDISFLVYRNFKNKPADMADQPGTGNSESLEAAHPPRHVTESVRLVNEDLVKVIQTLLESQQQYAELADEFSMSLELPAPYLFIYHSRKDWEKFQENLPGHTKAQLSLLLTYVTEQYADEYATADSLLAQDKISPRLLRYLFIPGDVLVSCVDGQYQGFVSKSWPKIDQRKEVSRKRAITSQIGTVTSLYGSQDSEARMASDKNSVYVCLVDVWHWAFDGNFQRQHSTLCLEIPAVANDTDAKGKGKNTAPDDNPENDVGEKKISELNVFPMRYASAEIVDDCRRRGKTFWKCRTRNYVSYQATERDSIQNLAGERYMIDLKTYRSLHPGSGSRSVPNELKDELGPEALARDVPPDEQFELLLPLKIKGYNLRIKKWFDLAADCISDVKWNKEAFKNLVIERKARDLIEALVSKQLAAEKGTDLIMGKGNGLVLLLHGGPGTGKTLTAESVAEIAEKPLYRVTCGDVGTKAEDVEKYLESVLHLGKIWGCVVLLDEADVFLEQRSLEDMERNALVSVFLRVLEYYEGILVLTSNRVGTFDEAFKSRIQLALHYPALRPYQRLRIWENFINRLESFAEDDKVDIADLRDHLEDLKEEKMNGRQIRNAITTARQYAEWKGRILTYKYLSEVIEISGRFDQYLVQLKEGLTEDQLAEAEGLRLADNYE